MMSLLPNSAKRNKTSGSKAVQEGADGGGADDDDCPRKTTYCITNLPGDCLNLIFKCLDTRDDRNSFGLTCRQWLHIQNNNHVSLWFRYGYWSYNYPWISPEIFPIVPKLLTRFQHLKHLSLSDHLKITDFGTSKSESFGSKVQSLWLAGCFGHSDTELSFMFSWFPRLTCIKLTSSSIKDRELEALAKCCSSLETVYLSCCPRLTDSGISSLLQNCRELRLLSIIICGEITGIGFLDCPKTLTHVVADRCTLKPEGVKAIVRGGGLEYLSLSTVRLFQVEEGSINTEAAVTISRGCPLLKKLFLKNCGEVELQGWEAISRNCKNLEVLQVYGCRKLCDLGLQALCNGCNKLSRLLLGEENSCSSSALELFKRKKPGVLVLEKDEIDKQM